MLYMLVSDKRSAKATGLGFWARAFWPNPDPILIVIFIAYRAIFYISNGVFAHGLFSDEVDHFGRVEAFCELFSLNLEPSVLQAAYASGVWPPLYPAVVALPLLIPSTGIFHARLLNFAFQLIALAFLLRCFPNTKPKVVIALAFAIFPPLASLAFQVRPENLSMMLMAIFLYFMTSRGLFERNRRPRPGKARGGYAVCGLLAGLMAVNHGVFLVFALYILTMMLLFASRAWVGIALFTFVLLPYILVMQLLHADTPILATSTSVNLAYNNNRHLSNDYGNYEEAREQIAADAKARVDAGQAQHFDRPLLVPASRYEAWNHAENVRLQLGRLAHDFIRADLGGYLARAWYRLSKLVRQPHCEGQYGCLLFDADRVLGPLFYGIALVMAVMLFLQESEVSLGSFRYSFASLALILPPIMIHLNTRLATMFALMALFGALWRSAPGPVHAAFRPTR